MSQGFALALDCPTSGAITSGLLGDGSVVSGSIASGQIGVTHLASGVLAGFLLTSGSVRSGNIGNGAVVSGSIASGQIGASHLASGAVFSLASGVIRSGHLGNGAVVSGSIASGQVSSAHFASGTIRAPASGSIRSGMLGNGAVVSGSVASGQLGAVHLASGTLGDPVFGTQAQYADSEVQSSTTSTSYELKLRLTTPSLPAGTYRIEWYFEWLLASIANDFEARVRLDSSSDFMEMNVEPKDNTNWNPVGGVIVSALSAGAHTIDIDYATESGDTAYIRRARLFIHRVS